MAAVSSDNVHAGADLLLSRGDVRGAIDALRRALAAVPDDFSGWMKLAALYRSVADVSGALAAIHRALDVRPNDFLALLFMGGLHEQRGETFKAIEVYRASIYQASFYDDVPQPVAIKLRQAQEFVFRQRKAVEGKLLDASAFDPIHAHKRTRFLDNVMMGRSDHHQQPTHYRYPGLADIEFFDFAYPDLRDRLRKNFSAIRNEFLDLLDQHADRQQPYVDFQPGQPVGQWAALNRSSDWNALHLQRYGEIDPVNAAACPRTIEALTGEERADIPGLAPNLMFSLLKPRTHIPPHHGVANFRSVLHLPLIVPPGCRFRVGGETREWQEGEPFIFDDTIEHEAWNEGGELRVVLIADVWRPELDATDRTIVRDVIAAQNGNAIVGAL